jgi:hypothetical protein
MTSNKIPVYYLEIPIEKESGRYYTCRQCNKSHFIKESEKVFDKHDFCNYTCEKCIKINKIYQEAYDKDFNKIKSAPKSFKFDFTPVSDYPELKYPWVLGKTYTIEIKEKE